MDKCPRCFKDISWIEERVRKGRKYYYAVHYEGYSRVDGRVRRRIKKCYLGPRVYEYVSRMHSDIGLSLHGFMVRDRFLKYLEMVSGCIPYLDPEVLRDVRDRLAGIISMIDDRLNYASSSKRGLEPSFKAQTPRHRFEGSTIPASLNPVSMQKTCGRDCRGKTAKKDLAPSIKMVAN